MQHIPHGTVITEPGIYLTPMEWYHQQLTIGPSISSSGLRTIESQSAAHYFAGSYLNPDAEKVDTTPFRIGKASHSLLLGDEVFEEHFVISPYDEFRTNEAKAWRGAANEAGLVVLKNAEYARILQMRDVLMREPLIKDGLLDGEAERSIVWRDEETGVWLKARPDVLPKAGWVVDYKTTADAHPRAVERSIWNYGYHMQLALVAEGLAALGMEIPREFAFVFQESKAPYAVTIQPLPLEAVWAGAKQNRTAIRQFAQCLSEGVWPAYGEGRDIQTPQFIIDRCAGIQTPDWIKPLEQAA